MIDEQWRVAWHVYESACQLPTSDRLRYVESQIEDPTLRKRIMSLLEREEQRSGQDTEPGRGTTDRESDSRDSGRDE